LKPRIGQITENFLLVFFDIFRSIFVDEPESYLGGANFWPGVIEAFSGPSHSYVTSGLRINSALRARPNSYDLSVSM